MFFRKKNFCNYAPKFWLFESEESKEEFIYSYNRLNNIEIILEEEFNENLTIIKNRSIFYWCFEIIGLHFLKRIKSTQ